MKEDELILVVPKKDLEDIGVFQGFKEPQQAYIDAILQGNAQFVKRGPAEVDPSLKQIIPYCVIVQENPALGEKRVLAYRRGESGGEQRLHAKWSLGIGGHINPIDSEGKDAFDAPSLRTALLRELEEELFFLSKEGRSQSQIHQEISFKTAGFINDDSNLVGQVHFGLIEIAKIPEGDVLPAEEAIAEIKFLTPKEIQELRPQLENWSQIVCDHLQEILS